MWVSRRTPSTQLRFRKTFTQSAWVVRRQLSKDIFALRESRQQEVDALTEVVQRNKFVALLEKHAKKESTQMCGGEGLDEMFADEGSSSAVTTLEGAGMTNTQLMTAIKAAFATQLLHIEARIASLLEYGFYTIGPCGEECLGAVGVALRPTDPMALHYRHTAAQVARQLSSGRTIEEIVLDRARGYCTSIHDPVTGGAHCAIGGGDYDFIVTSTLASQASPAVGRALGSSLAKRILANTDKRGRFDSDSISYVSLGDGSVNNAHFLAAANLACYASHRKFKCPVLFGVSDNGVCISLPGHGWLPVFLKGLEANMRVFHADGTDILDVFHKTSLASAYVRDKMRPATLVFHKLPRRFGHAATDRQFAYLSQESIQQAADNNPLEHTCSVAVGHGITTYTELLKMYTEIEASVKNAFQTAANEPRIESYQQMIARNSQPLADVSNALSSMRSTTKTTPPNKIIGEVMRKHMTRVITEQMSLLPQMIYIGEDVTHGGYYIVTEGIAKEFPGRIVDFPPDETSLIGAGIGFSQSGLLPIVEIPYAKYLDCGADMFFEAVISNWLSDSRSPNGMIFRLQGFDRGVFGGNFHTHNMLYNPPGLDLVAYSNGNDYARGFRYCVQQALGGRVVMLVDSTNLLNLRNVHDKDGAWMRRFPYLTEQTSSQNDSNAPVTVLGDGSQTSTTSEHFLPFDAVMVYGNMHKARVAVVTYGNGVVTALQSTNLLGQQDGTNVVKSEDVCVVDHPYLTAPCGALEHVLQNFECVVFADVCKEGQSLLAGFAATLRRKGKLPRNWTAVAAPHTYNPLGTTVTFLSAEQIASACKQVLEEASLSK